MALDHSETYRRRSLRNVIHRHRLQTILALVERMVPAGVGSYADFGASNGYVTDQVRQKLGLSSALAFDHAEDHFAVGRTRHPALLFRAVDLNRPVPLPRCDLVTCFETLEHVGDIPAAVDNLVRAVAPGGRLLISVPVEHGGRGLLKYAVKRGLYRYSLRELPGGEALAPAYQWALWRNARLGEFRAPRTGWSTHFGFDTRDVEDALRAHGPSTLWSAMRGFTRFFVVTP